MNQKEFNQILDKTTNQFFIFSTGVSRPKYFVKHLYIVTNQKGKINRFEIYRFKNKKNPEHGHIHKNYVAPTTGHRKKLFNKNKKIDSKLIKIISGNLAEKINKSVNENYLNYKFKNKYNLLGPNCNTYVQWILNQFPETKIKLPFLAIGKNK
jgi:hypothetical protein